MPLNLNENHVDQALARFVEQFKNKPNLTAVVAAFAERYQLLENVVWDVHVSRWIDFATDSRLDDIGALVGQPREGRVDGVYRSWIRARILLNRTNATPDDSLDVLELILPDTTQRSFSDEYPAAYVIRLYNFGDDPVNMYRILKLAKPAGVRFILEYQDDNGGNSFTFSSTTSIIAGDTARGFAGPDESTGGRFAGAVA